MAENSGDLSLGYMMGQSDGNNGGFGGGMWEGIWGIVLLAMVLSRGSKNARKSKENRTFGNCFVYYAVSLPLTSSDFLPSVIWFTAARAALLSGWI